jgi:FeS assembly SUF system regulator
MIRMTRQTDYGIVLLTRMAHRPAAEVHTARDLAAEARLPLPMVSKILKMLAKKGLLVSHRGAKGGYSLAQRPEEISVSRIISAMEGPVAMTNCSFATPGTCEHETVCPTRGNWQRINRVVRQALEQISLLEMAHPLPEALVTLGGVGRAGGAGAR